MTVIRAQCAPDIVHEFDLSAQYCVKEPLSNLQIRMEVGTEDALHAELKYNKSKFYLRDVVIDKIYFLPVRINIKRMEIETRNRESDGAGANVYNGTVTVNPTGSVLRVVRSETLNELLCILNFFFTQ